MKPSTRELTVSDVAISLGVSTKTVRRYIAAGHLEAWKLPGNEQRAEWRIPESQIEEFKSRRARTPTYDRYALQRLIENAA